MSNFLELIFGSQKKSKKSRKSSKKPKASRERTPETESEYRQYINKYFGKSYDDVKLNIKPKKYKNYTWGLGAEHEMQLFHISRDYDTKGVADSKIIFDSQESTCLLLNKGSESTPGACTKMLKRGPNKYYYHDHPEVKKVLDKVPKLQDKDLNFLKEVPWELSGRQVGSDECKFNKQPILTRIPVLMPEIITGNFKNRTIESICDELIFMENKFIQLQMKNPFTKQKVEKYGELRQLPYGSIGNVKVPKKYNSHLKTYEFENKKYTDYLGSYHVTITLPFTEKTGNIQFIKRHQNYGNMIQWLEPLLLTAFFSSDPRNCISDKMIARGSFRILSTGWGNLAGSDLRVLTKKKGVGRYANMEVRWRRGLKIPSSKKIDTCESRVQITERETLTQPVGVLSSNIRTFGFVKDEDLCKKLYCSKDEYGRYRGCECPKVSGYKMKKPYGMEVRIFDHFNSKHLIELMRILVYLAENSRKHQCREYVYYNQAWNNATKKIMTEGWKAIMPVDFIKEINRNLGLRVELQEMKAFGLLKEVVRQLFEKNKDGLFSEIMLRDKYEEPPKLPQINRFSWQIQFNARYAEQVAKFIKKNYETKIDYTLKAFENIFYKKYEKRKWKNNFLDVLYALEAKPHKLLNLKVDKGRIISIRLTGI